MIWFSLLIPIITIVAMRVFASRHIVWWEYLLPIAASFVIIGAGKLLTETMQVQDTEYWGGWVSRATYEEPWDERVSCRHAKYRTEYYECGDGKTSRTCSRQVFEGYEHAYDVDDHPAKWYIEDSNGFTIGISSARFEWLSQQFNERTFVELNRDYHSQDGNAYVAHWDKDWTTLQPVTTVHRYENRVAVSKSIYSYPDVNPKKSPVYDYPEVNGYDCTSVLSKKRWAGQGEIDKLNAVLGAKKQVRVWVLLWEDAPRQVGFDQEAYWKGSNKNEIVICVSYKGNEVQWAHVFSWSKSENLKTAIQSYLAVDNPKLDFRTFAPWLQSEVESKWNRRNWKDFDYLTVEPPTWAVVTLWIITGLVCVGTAYFCIYNGEDLE